MTDTRAVPRAGEHREGEQRTMKEQRTIKEQRTMSDHLDDDENVKMMRATAQAIGLTQLIADAARSPTHSSDHLAEALRLLGVTADDVKEAGS